MRVADLKGKNMIEMKEMNRYYERQELLNKKRNWMIVFVSVL